MVNKNKTECGYNFLCQALQPLDPLAISGLVIAEEVVGAALHHVHIKHKIVI